MLTTQRVVELCKQHGLYRTPELNDKLYLHYQGFKALDGQVLGQYTALKCLWLQGNGISKIQGLENLTSLRTLCLHENVIEVIEGLETLTMLNSLSLQKNFVTRIANLERLTSLQTLNLGHNSLGPDASAIEHVLAVPTLETLDVQANKLEDVGVLHVVRAMPNLKVLYLMGNPVVKALRHYRKRIIGSCVELRYLDDRPVFEEEKRRVTAWHDVFTSTNGDVDAATTAERAELQTIRDEKRQQEERRLADFDSLIQQAKMLPPPPPRRCFVNVDELD